ncbi:unnamed protein product [Caenorhabditis sp. 36 PRJEB53466]|nr:unnamed protein product [Caenorhabditis sp. 36 PRJEB53466]
MRLFAVLGLITLCLTPQPTSLKTNSSSLRQICDDLSILGRIVNAIAIHEGLATDSIRLVDLLAELFDVESGNGLLRLKELTIDSKSLTSDVDSILQKIGKLNENPVAGASQVKLAIELLTSMQEHLGELEKATNASLTSAFVNASKSAIRETSHSSLLSTAKFKTLFSHLNDINTMKRVDASDLSSIQIDMVKKIGKDIKEMWVDVENQILDLKDYEKKLEKTLAIEGNFKVLEPVAKLAFFSQQYKRNELLFNSLSAKLQLLMNDVNNLLPIASLHTKFSAVGSALKACHPYVTELTSPRTSARILTRGFASGIKDFARFPHDIQSEWFKEKIAAGKEREVQNPSELTNATVQLLEGMAKDGKHLHGIANLQDSMNVTADIFERLRPIPYAPLFADFRYVVEYSGNFSEQVGLLKAALEQYAGKEHTQIVSALEKVREHSEEFARDDSDNITTGNVFDYIKRVAETEGFQETLQFLNDTSTLLEPFFQSKYFASLSNRPNWESVQSVQSSFGETNVMETLKRLKNATYNAPGVEKAIRFGIDIRKAEKGVFFDAKSLFNSMGKMKKAAVGVISASATSARRRRALDGKKTLKKLEKPDEMTTSVARGVDTLRMMSDVLDGKDHVLAAVDASREVDAVIGALPTINASWTRIRRRTWPGKKLLRFFDKTMDTRHDAHNFGDFKLKLFGFLSSALTGFSVWMMKRRNDKQEENRRPLQAPPLFFQFVCTPVADQMCTPTDKDYWKSIEASFCHFITFCIETFQEASTIATPTLSSTLNLLILLFIIPFTGKVCEFLRKLWNSAPKIIFWPLRLFKFCLKLFFWRIPLKFTAEVYAMFRTLLKYVLCPFYWCLRICFKDSGSRGYQPLPGNDNSGNDDGVSDEIMRSFHRQMNEYGNSLVHSTTERIREDQEANRAREAKMKADLAEYEKSLTKPTEQALRREDEAMERRRRVQAELRAAMKRMTEMRENRFESFSDDGNKARRREMEEEEFRKRLAEQERQCQERVDELRRQTDEIERKTAEDVENALRDFEHRSSVYWQCVRMQLRFEAEEQKWSDFLSELRKALVKISTSYSKLHGEICEYLKEPDDRLNKDFFEREAKMFGSKVQTAQMMLIYSFANLKEVSEKFEDRIFVKIIMKSVSQAGITCEQIGQKLVEIMKDPTREPELRKIVSNLSPRSIPSTDNLKRTSVTAKLEDFEEFDNIPLSDWYDHFFQ